jgi:DNA end-binding protein Ku
MPSIVWKGQLTFGLVSVPVKLYRAARKERVSLHYVHRSAAVEEPASEQSAAEASWGLPEEEYAPPPSAGGAAARRVHYEPAGRVEPVEQEEAEPEPVAPVSRVRQTLVSSEDEQPVPRSEVLRGYEVERDRYVVFEQQELRKLQRRTSPAMEIVRSVRLEEIDPVFFETSYYLVPDKGGERAYAILFAALRAGDHVALARVGMHGREHVVIIRAGSHGMIAHTMFYVDEVRFENEYRTDTGAVSEKELDLARTFLTALEAPFAPEEFKDVYREELQAMIAQKAAEAKVALTPERPAPAAAPVVDILEALRKSIAMAKKPAAPEPQPARKSPARVTEIKGKRQTRKAR